MKNSKINIAGNIGLMVFGLIAVLSGFSIFITYISATNYNLATTQLLNKDVAAHIAKFYPPFEGSDIDRKRADSVIYNAMVLNPTVEVYFLNPIGHIMYYQQNEFDLKVAEIPIAPIQNFISEKGLIYLEGIDPKQPNTKKIFSAAQVIIANHLFGYIYVILGGYEYRNVSSMLFGNHASSLAIKTFISVVIFSILLSFLYIRRLQHKFNKMHGVIKKFEAGDLEARFEIKPGDELSSITNAFNQVAGQLSSSISKLKENEQYRKEFVANISHDLKTPLSVAHGYAETLIMNHRTENSNDFEEKKYLQIICKKIEHVGNLVEQLSELSKLESTQFTPNKELFVFAEILEEAAESAQGSARSKNIILACDGCQETSLIFADIKMIERVIQNLIENAIKHTSLYGNIMIGLKKVEGELLFSIANSGIPLKPETLAWINTNEDTSKRPHIGLGLAIIKKILYLHQYNFYASLKNDNVNVFQIKMKCIIHNEKVY